MPETAREEAEKRIRELALKAHSRGPWTAETLEDEPTVNWTFDTEGYGPGHGPLAWCNHPEDAQYIAAVSPEVVLALLDEVAALRALSVPETENWAEFDALAQQIVNLERSGPAALPVFFHRTRRIRDRAATKRPPVPVEEDNR